MTLTTRTNEYGHEVVDCPFCEKWVYVRESSKVSPDPLRDLKRHITNDAKSEALALCIGKAIEAPKTPTPHLEYYVEHTYVSPAIPKVSAGRRYDNDLTV